MIKAVIGFKRKPGMAVEAFQAHWSTTHAGLVAQLPGLRRYVQNHTLMAAYAKGEPAFDAVAESWFDSTQAMKALVGTPHYDAVLADERNFIDGATMRSIITDEVVVKEQPAAAGAVKSVTLVTHRAGMPIEAFFRYWRDVHGPLCAGVAAMRRYVQSHTRASIYGSGRTPDYDGAAMSWFDSMEVLREAARSADFARLRADAATFIDGGRSPSVLASEHVIA
jgi:uncharacterized protein (TIGR02118 family)